jgi:hypothetical protein
MYQGIINAAKKLLKPNPNITPNSYDKQISKHHDFDLSKASVKSIRHFFAEIHSLTPTVQYLIDQKGIQKYQLKDVYTLPFIITKEIKLFMLHFNIIHNILSLKS